MGYTKTKRILNKLKNKQQLNTIQTPFILPNHSGDHSAGKRLNGPESDTDLVNKKYVDDEISNASSNFAKLNGTNQPFTGDIEAPKITSDTAKINGTLTAGLTKTLLDQVIATGQDNPILWHLGKDTKTTSAYLFRAYDVNGSQCLRVYLDSSNFHWWLDQGQAFYFNASVRITKDLAVSGAFRPQGDVNLGSGTYATSSDVLVEAPHIAFDTWAWNGTNGYSINSQWDIFTKQTGYTNGDANMYWTKSGIYHMTLDKNGNLGLGTTSPQEKLEVKGNIKLSGQIQQDGASRIKLTKTTYQFLNNGIWSICQVNSILWDNLTEYQANYGFTPKQAGYYLIQGAFQISSIASNSSVGIAIYKNGSSITTKTITSIISNTSIDHSISDIVYLTTSDTISLYAYQNSSSNVILQQNRQILNIHRLS